MIIIRPVTQKDLNSIVGFSFELMVGMTNLPRERDKLETKIANSESCFKRDVQKPDVEEYYFVLEDLTTGGIGGVCGILAENNMSRTFFYQVETIVNNSKHISVPKELKILRAVPNATYCSEVCSLFLQPTFRHSGNGRLLSLSRFLFMAPHQHRFEKNIIVEMRGYINEKQSSPFWEAVGHHFCNLSFLDLMAQLDRDRTFIAEILPKYPIYIDLLPKDAQDVIGKTHEGSKPALAMLLQEGFCLQDEVDIFDAGAILSAPLKEVRTVKQSALVTITTTADLLKDEIDYILANDKMDFRACYGKLKFTSENEALINEKVAEALQVINGDQIRYVPAH